uniref:Uncharacterized protein n=1 Tax=Cacopsylla melanoneura TaxID=428564 RepID=A0A8D9A6P3_9HEMI
MNKVMRKNIQKLVDWVKIIKGHLIIITRREKIGLWKPKMGLWNPLFVTENHSSKIGFHVVLPKSECYKLESQHSSVECPIQCPHSTHLGCLHPALSLSHPIYLGCWNPALGFSHPFYLGCWLPDLGFLLSIYVECLHPGIGLLNPIYLGC